MSEIYYFSLLNFSILKIPYLYASSKKTQALLEEE